MKKFNVLLWDINRDVLTHYDVLPYFRRAYQRKLDFTKEHSEEELSDYWKVPKTLDEFKKFVEGASLYQFWSRCEYEIILHAWPARKNDYKLDVHEQIMMNIDIVAEILYNELCSN